MRAVLSLIFGGLAIVACSGVPGIPSFPPLGSIPPIVLPSGLVLPSIPPIVLPSGDPGTSLCRLMTAQEVGTIMGTSQQITEQTADSCTYTGGLSAINIRIEQGDLSTAQFLLGDTARQVQIGQYQAVAGVFFGGPLLYIQRGSEQLVVQGILIGDDQAAIDKVIAIGQTAAARW